MQEFKHIQFLEILTFDMGLVQLFFHYFLYFIDAVL